MIKVILVDDHQIVRNGIRMLIEDMEGIEVIDEAGSAEEVLAILKSKSPDIVIVDLSLPGMSGIELTSVINYQYPEMKVLVLTMYTSEDFVFNSVKAGALGYLPKNTTKTELNKAIVEIMEGREYFSDKISNIILKSFVNKAKSGAHHPNDGLKVLSTREKEVLKLFTEGKTNKQIADDLFISTRTVESHKNHIMQKLQLKTPVDLIKFAIKMEILQI